MTDEASELIRKRQNRQSTFKTGRAIGEKREKLETKNERNAARKRDKKRQARRVVFTVFGFAALGALLIFLVFFFVGSGEPDPIEIPAEAPVSAEPTIEIIDEDASAGGKITNRMRSFVALAEQDFRDLGYAPERAVIPTGSVREVDFYLENHPGFIKMTIDRGSAVSVEDADRMLRYLAGQGINEFVYIDVRVAGKAYWR